MCGAVAGGLPVGVDAGKEAVIQGVVRRDGVPVVGYVRLLDGTGEFTAEVRRRRLASSASSRRLARGRCALWYRGGTADQTVTAAVGEIAQVEVAV